MCRIDGPFKDREKWRVRVVDRETGKRQSYIYATETEARLAIPKLGREYRRPVGEPLGKALQQYEAYQGLKGNRPRSILSTTNRLRAVFRDLDVITGDLKSEVIERWWGAFVGTRTRFGAGPSFDTRANTLAEAKTFVRWCRSRGWIESDTLLDGIEVLGKRRRGKPQLTEEESRSFLAAALKLGTGGDAGGTAAATALLLGMRASEIAERIVRDLDSGGRILAVTAAKTAAGVRRLRVPALLQPLLQALASGKGPGDRLFGAGANRHWVLRSAARVCAIAGVPPVTPHGLRGTHATLAVGAGVSGEAVAASLGHESFAVTAAHYAQPEAVSGAKAAKVADILG